MRDGSLRAVKRTRRRGAALGVGAWDNARIHSVEEVREMLEAAGAELLTLPRYSPDLSPIEPGWAKIKLPAKRLRPETSDELSDAVSHGVASVRPSDVAGWFAMCGYLHQREWLPL
jgi:transposase